MYYFFATFRLKTIRAHHLTIIIPFFCNWDSKKWIRKDSKCHANGPYTFYLISSVFPTPIHSDRCLKIFVVCLSEWFAWASDSG